MSQNYKRKKVKINASLFLLGDYVDSMRRLEIYQNDERLREIVAILDGHIQSYFPSDDIEAFYLIAETIAPQGDE